MFLYVLFRKAMRLKYGFHGHIAGRHDKRIVGYFGIAAYDLPLFEVIAVIGRCGKLYRRACRCRRSAYCCGAVVIRNDIHIVLLCSRRKFKFRVCIIIHMGVGGIGEEVIRIVLTVLAGENHGIVLVFGSDADGCAAAHGSAYAQLFARRQIHVVCIAGNGVALYNGIAAYFKLPIVAGVDVYSAAALSSIVFNGAAGEVADRTAAVNIHRAAVAGSCVATDNAASHIQDRRLLIQINCAAIHGGISGDDASREVERGIFVEHMHRAALFASMIVAYLAAGHGRRYAIVKIDRSAVSTGRIVDKLCTGDGNSTAGHIDNAAVTVSGLIAGYGAANQIDRTAA